MAAKYSLTEEHRAQLESWAARWIANAMSTRAMDGNDRRVMRKAVKGLYEAAGRQSPARIVFVPSPLALRLAGGFSAAIWYLRQKGKIPTRAATSAATRAATEAATSAATSAATRAATEAATWAATSAATEAATSAATWAATRAATEAATSAATWAATSAATWDATSAATEAATSAATRAATEAATRDATEAATWAATWAATSAATWDATWAATRAATEAATAAATSAATEAATWAATSAATWDATWAATEALMGDWFYGGCDLVSLAHALLGAHAIFGLECAHGAWRMWQGGNQWCAWDSFLSFFRHIAHLPLDYTHWDAWEQASLHGGPRIMHPEFCMVSDRPEVLTVDEQNRPHGADGPFCRWRDGFSLFAWHGVRVPAKYYLRDVPAREILAEQNAEVRRAMMERYDYRHGKGAFIQACGAKVIDTAVQPMRPGEPDAINELLAIDLPGDPEGRMVYIKMVDPSTGRIYMCRVHPELRPLLGNDKAGRPLFGKPQKLTVLNALASTHRMRGEEYVLQQES